MPVQHKNNYRVALHQMMYKRGYVPVTYVAELVKVNRVTVGYWVRDGKVEGHSVGTAKYVSYASLKAHLGDRCPPKKEFKATYIEDVPAP